MERWDCKYYQSGTCIVQDMAAPVEPFEYGVTCRKPWFYIYGPVGGDETETFRNRYKTCEDVRDYMNGGDRPKWLDDMNRVTETHAVDLDGTKITATGPMVDRNPPRCDWVQDDTDEARDARARLMDRLFGVA